MHIKAITNTVTSAIIRLDMDPIFKVSEVFMKGLDENDYIQGKHMNLIKVLSESLQDNTGLSNRLGECFSIVSEDIVFITMAEITHDQKADAIFQLFCQCSNNCCAILSY